jgi:hypothetical protein
LVVGAWWLRLGEHDGYLAVDGKWGRDGVMSAAG